MNEVARELRVFFAEIGEIHPNQTLCKILGRKKQAVSNKLCGRKPFTIDDLSKIDREYDLEPERLKRMIHNYTWEENGIKKG